MSFIASLAAVGTAAAGAVGVTGLGTAAAALTGAGVLSAGGAALGAGTAALTGGDPGKGALMGGIAGPFAAPAVAPAGAAAAGAGAGAGGIGSLGTAGSSALTAGELGFTSGAGAGAGAAGAGAAGAGGGMGFAGLSGGTGLTAGGAGAGAGGIGSLGAAGSSALTAGELGFTSGAVTGAGAGAGVGAGAGAGGLAGLIAEYPMLTNAGIGALTGAITNPDDPMKGALAGGISGGIGGYGAGELAGYAGSGGLMGQIGTFAAENPNLTSAGLGMLAQPLVSGLIPSSNDSSKIPGILSPEEEKKQWIAALNRYKPSLAPGYAAGGITDLDNFQSNAQNVSTTGLNFAQPTTGTLSIPNPQEVANPEGYGANSTALMAVGGIADLGGYAAGGRPNLLHGSGDGVSDDIPATIAGKQPARLAAGEYVVPSRIVSELGNGSTDAGAARLDDMVKRIQTGRRKTLHGKDYAKDTRAYKHLPA